MAEVDAEIVGEGFPLLMLHGWGQSGSAWRSLAELLPGYCCHLITFPGFGSLPPPEKTWGGVDYAEAVLRYMEHEQIRQGHFLGHSFGGKVALLCAGEAPEKVVKIGLLAPAVFPPKRTPRQKLRLSALALLRNIVKSCDRLCGTHLYEERFIPAFASTDYKQAGAMRAVMVRSVQEELSPLLPTIKAPVQIIWGEEDQETPLEMGYRLQKQLPDAQMASLPGHGHQLLKNPASHLVARLLHEGWSCG